MLQQYTDTEWFPLPYTPPIVFLAHVTLGLAFIQHTGIYIKTSMLQFYTDTVCFPLHTTYQSFPYPCGLGVRLAQEFHWNAEGCADLDPDSS